MDLLNWESNGDDLLIGGESVSSLARRFGTPLYLYDASIIVDRINRIQRGFPEFTLLYSIKSNPNEAICSLMAKSGLGADIASKGEFDIAQRVGFSVHNIAVIGPGKRREDLEAYIDAGIEMIHLESQRELQLVEEISAKKQINTSVAVRVNTAYVLQDAHEQMSGVPSQFGIPEECVVDVLARNKRKHINYIGIHVYAGSQILNPSILLDHFTKVAMMSREIALDVGFDLQLINFGGGFGVPYDRMDQHLDIKALGAAVTNALTEVFPDQASKPAFYIELGRYLVAESGIFLTEVLDVKSTRGTTFVVTDSGINNFARPAMPWAMQHPCALVSKLSNTPTGTYKVVGSLCQPSDVLCENVELDDPRPGDILAFFNAGAYGYTMSPQLYHSKLMPMEVLYYEGDFHVIRDRLSPRELLFAQSIPKRLQLGTGGGEEEGPVHPR